MLENDSGKIRIFPFRKERQAVFRLVAGGEGTEIGNRDVIFSPRDVISNKKGDNSLFPNRQLLVSQVITPCF
jgi:hypothetical protein